MFFALELTANKSRRQRNPFKFRQESDARNEMSKNNSQSHRTLQSASSFPSCSSITDFDTDDDKSSFDSLNAYIKMKKWETNDENDDAGSVRKLRNMKRRKILNF
jgi:hypothetical protein